MPDDRVAEWMLSLVASPDRAGPTVGDLLEEAAVRGRWWFWSCVARTAASFLWANLTAAPLRMTGFAVVGWFVFMVVCVVQLFCGWVLLTLLWGLGYFLTHHTGLELLVTLLKVRIDWAPLPRSLARGIELLVIGMAAPFQVGRYAARCWPGREVAAWVILLLIWPLMAMFVPFVAVSTKVTLQGVPVIQTFVLLGALWERKVALHTTELKPN